MEDSASPGRLNLTLRELRKAAAKRTLEENHRRAPAACAAGILQHKAKPAAESKDLNLPNAF